MIKKGFISVLMMIFIVFSFIPTGQCEESSVFKYYVLFDGASGQIISQQGGDETVENSGLAQMMSILIFARQIEMEI